MIGMSNTTILLLCFMFSFICFITHAQDAPSGEAPPADEDATVSDGRALGRFPESVYRELSWYGIYQIQPMLLSSKNRMVALLLWMHSLNRPHIILETAPDNLLDHHRIDRTLLSEEAAKWSKDQLANHENVMETIKTGGNGITIRTVVGHMTRKHTLLVHSGNYYRCVGSEPDLKAYSVSAYDIHTKMCENGKPAELLDPNIDPCIEAEYTGMEYSFTDGWNFCFGAGERPESSHFINGTLNCGTKTKVSYKDFLESCAIDNNVVISYMYFGDEPRKEPMDNGTLCPSWTPCKLSYVYRVEPPDTVLPHFPTTTPDPCEVEMCTVGPNSVVQNPQVPDDYEPPWMNQQLLNAQGKLTPTKAAAPE